MDGTQLSGLRVGVQVVAADADDSALGLAGIHPLGYDDGNIHLDGLLPQRAAALRADKVGRVDADGVDKFPADAVQRRCKGVFLLRGQHARRHRDTGQIGHLVRATGELLGLVGASGGAQDQVEGVFGVDGETADLGAACLKGTRYRAGLGAIPVEGERFERGSGQVDGIPFQDQGGLGCVAEAQDGRRGRLDAVGVQDAFLEGLESGGAGSFGIVVARDGDIDDTTGGDVVWEENGGEFDL